LICCKRGSLNSGGIFDCDKKKKRFEEIEILASAPDFWNDQTRAKKINKEREDLNNLLGEFEEQFKRFKDVEAIGELLDESPEEDLVKEADNILSQVETALKELEFRRMLSGDNDEANAILSINAGAGGTEACDWAEMLLRMYRRWCDNKGYKNEVVDFTAGEGAGFRSATLMIEGKYAYGYLKAENGVHRLVRISPFDANKRRHTSFCSVFVMPDIQEDIEIEINESDLRVDTFRSSGAGGQHVNKTDSAVRLTHEPTGIVVACQSGRSQHQNKATAMRLLKAKLYELEMEKKLKEAQEIEKSKKRIEWGSQIRSYVMQPYQMVKDHRTGIDVGNVTAVMDGDIDQFIREYLLKYS